MKSSLIKATAIMAITPAIAHAQSSVTLYGLIDTGIGYVNNLKGGSVVQATSGRLSGSRWGVKGSEDLGNGLSAVFTLENGFKPTDGTLGQGGREFGRSAFVGLAKTGIGTLTFGRQYEPLADLVAQFSGPGFWLPSTHIGDNDNLNQTFRISNAVKFRSDPIAGLTVDGMYAFSNQAAGSNGEGFANNRAWSIAANYVNGPLSFGGGYLLLDHPNSKTNTSGAVGGGSSTTGDDYSSAYLYNLDGGVARQQVAAAGVNYKVGSALLGAAFSHSELNYNDGATRKFNNYEANVRYLVTPAMTILGIYTFTDGRANGLPGETAETLKPKWHQFTLGVDYALSKRTDLYLSGVYQLAAGDASIKSGSTFTKVAAIAAAGGGSTTNRQVAVFSGIRTRF
ncbi:porin [Paraburkholderia tropica]|uniref:porin n=1 Tax=Paraburkholderia tropica TaxID=92647 RepID=UPI00158FDCF1|nr:porin [Paraburkholderia tropica]